MNIAKFLKIVFLIENSNGCFFQFDKVTVQHWASVNLLLLIKNQLGWFLLKRFVDLRVCYIITKNHSNTFLLINLQKTKTCSNSQGIYTTSRYTEISHRKKKFLKIIPRSPDF